MTVPLAWYVVLGVVLFVLGAAGVLLRRNGMATGRRQRGLGREPVGKRSGNHPAMSEMPAHDIRIPSQFSRSAVSRPTTFSIEPPTSQTKARSPYRGPATIRSRPIRCPGRRHSMMLPTPA